MQIGTVSDRSGIDFKETLKARFRARSHAVEDVCASDVAPSAGGLSESATSFKPSARRCSFLLGSKVKEDSMASPGINFIMESEGQPDHRDVCAFRSDLRPQLIRSGQFRGKRRREIKTEPLRRLMAAVLCEAVIRFQRNLFHTSLYSRCEFVEAEFWLFKDQSKALFSFNNVCDFLSLDPQHIRRQLCDWRRSHVRAASSTETTMKDPVDKMEYSAREKSS